MKIGKEITDFGSNFVGIEFSTDDVVSELIRNYINGSVNDVKAVEVYNTEIEEVKKHYEKEQVTAGGVTRNAKFMGTHGYLPLDMINKDGCAYYSDGDSYVLLRDDMSVATDMEDFYMGAFIEDIEENNYDYLNKDINPKDYL